MIITIIVSLIYYLILMGIIFLPLPPHPPSQSPIRIVKKKKKSMPRPSSGFNLHRCQIDGSGWIGAGPVEPPGDVRSAMDPGGIWWTRVNWPAANSMTQ